MTVQFQVYVKAQELRKRGLCLISPAGSSVTQRVAARAAQNNISSTDERQRAGRDPKTGAH